VSCLLSACCCLLWVGPLERHVSPFIRRGPEARRGLVADAAYSRTWPFDCRTRGRLPRHMSSITPLSHTSLCISSHSTHLDFLSCPVSTTLLCHLPPHQPTSNLLLAPRWCFGSLKSKGVLLDISDLCKASGGTAEVQRQNWRDGVPSSGS
jgi:hypothetical protein